MTKNINCFIEEDLEPLQQWAKEVRLSGGIVAGSNKSLIDEISKQTISSESLSVDLSGAWLEVCIFKFIRDLLSENYLKNILPDRDIQNLSVDLKKCIAFAECHSPMSTHQRLNMLKALLGDRAQDERLNLLT